jgi:hypothetical protein
MNGFDCPPILAPETQNCSGRGLCLSASVCDCPDGWTGIGDFAFGAPSCAINVKAVAALWGLAGTLHFFVFCFALYYLKVKSKQTNRSKTPLLLGVLILGSSTFMCTTGWIRAISPLRTIGSDPAVTVTFVIGATCFWSGCHTFIYSFIALSLKQARIFRTNDETKERTLLHLKISLPISNAFSMVGCLVPLGMLSATNAFTVSSLATAHYVILALELAVTGLWLTPLFVRGMISEIKQVSGQQTGQKSQILQSITSKMERFLAELRNQSITNITCAGLFGFWPFLQVYGSSYFLPFAWTSGAIVGALGLYLNLPVAKESSGKGSSSATGDKDNSQLKAMSSAMSTKNGKAQLVTTAVLDSSYVDPNIGV